jgi:hypothetical protein
MPRESSDRRRVRLTASECSSHALQGLRHRSQIRLGPPLGRQRRSLRLDDPPQLRTGFHHTVVRLALENPRQHVRVEQVPALGS